MTTLDRLPTQIAPPPEALAEAVASIRAGRPFTCVLGDDPAQRSALLQSVIDTVADLETRFVHVGNPLRAPLTLERVFMQVMGPEADVRLERDGAALTRILAGPVGDEARLIVVIQQAESLDKEALQTLRAMAPSFSSAAPRVQMLLCGPVAFGSMMGQPVKAQERSPEPVRPARQAAPAMAPAAEPATPAAPAPRRRKWPYAAFASLLLLAAGAAFAWRTQPQLRARLGLFPRSAAAPAPPAVTAPAPATVAPAPPTANPAEEAGMLRREFDDFIATRPDAAGLTAAEKDELFKEFLQRRRERVQ
jgi:hypothetical protein